MLEVCSISNAGEPRWEVEQTSKGVLVHNYGHGPAGWTLAPGSGHHVVKLLQQHIASSSLRFSSPITIVGAGVIGLFTARALLSAGYRNLSIHAARVADLTSHRAGGFLALAGIPVSEQLRPTLDKIALSSYDEWKNIADGKDESVRSAYYPFRAFLHGGKLEEDSHGLQCYIQAGKMTVRDVVVDFGQVKREMQCYDNGVFMDTGALMGELLKDVQARGVRLHQQHIPSLHSLLSRHAVVFNCTGHSSSILLADSKCIGALGHTISLVHQLPFLPERSYCLSSYNPEVEEDGLAIKRATYCHPRSGDGCKGEVGLLGGTFITGVDENGFGTERSEREWRLIVDRAREFFYGERATSFSDSVPDDSTRVSTDVVNNSA